MTIDEARECIHGKLNCMNKCGVFERDDSENKNLCDDCNYCYSQGNFGQQKEAFKVAINALEEVQKYRAIGTVEECRAAVEIIRYMIQEGIEPEVLEAYVWFEDELVKKGFTVKSVLEAREKQIAAKPLGGKDIEGNEYAICRECSAILSDGEWFAQYCPDCGKKVDWGEKEYGGLCNRF